MQFPVQLPRGVYAVGGFTRDAVRNAMRAHGFQLCHAELEQAVAMARPTGDVDLAGVLTETELASALGGRYVQSVNERTGTVIVTDGNAAYEYTRFREETYADDGSHEPLSVIFHSDLTRDARRRDFACNAIYFEPASGKLYDPMGGIDDLRRGVLRAVDGERTLRYDGLRILRLVRFCATGDMVVDAETERLARAYVGLLDAIPRERVYKELVGMLTPRSARKAVAMLVDYGLVRQLFGKEQVSFDCVSRASKYAFEAFFADMAELDPTRVSSLCRAFRVPNHTAERIAAICKSHGEGAELASLADHLEACVDALGEVSAAGRYLSKVKQSGAPVSVRDMAVGGEDVMAQGISGKQVGVILKRLQAYCVTHGIANERKTLLALLKEQI